MCQARRDSDYDWISGRYLIGLANLVSALFHHRWLTILGALAINLMHLRTVLSLPQTLGRWMMERITTDPDPAVRLCDAYLVTNDGLPVKLLVLDIRSKIRRLFVGLLLLVSSVHYR